MTHMRRVEGPAKKTNALMQFTGHIKSISHLYPLKDSFRVDRLLYYDAWQLGVCAPTKCGGVPDTAAFYLKLLL
jgi:hypothetical protein